MKMKFMLIGLLLITGNECFSQYIGVKAKYTETRLVDDFPNPPKRENRLILSFYEVNASGTYNPITLSNYDIYLFKEGLQYGSYMGGVNDSSGNNYPGYIYTAPQAVSYFNTNGINYIDCNPNLTTHYTVNGHFLDCGFVGVSYWDSGNEFFTAPNICLPYYSYPDPYANSPGNVNFYQPIPATPPYNFYSYTCSGTSQTVIRGVLQKDTSSGMLISLPVHFADVKGSIDATGISTIYWSNLTESDIFTYEIERSDDSFTFHSAGTILPIVNNGGRADYHFSNLQVADKNYYRIKATENNGKIFYSTIIYLRKDDNPAQIANASFFTVYPNPVLNGSFSFQLTDAIKGRYVFTVYNQQGVAVKQKMINHEGGLIKKAIDMTGLPAGLYRAILWSSTQHYTQPIIYVN